MTQTSPGWYPDGSDRLRWWDGTAWTEHTAPRNAGAAGVRQAAYSGQNQAGQASSSAGAATARPSVTLNSSDYTLGSYRKSSTTQPSSGQSGYSQSGYSQSAYEQSATDQSQYDSRTYDASWSATNSVIKTTGAYGHFEPTPFSGPAAVKDQHRGAKAFGIFLVIVIILALIIVGFIFRPSTPVTTVQKYVSASVNSDCDGVRQLLTAESAARVDDWCTATPADEDYYADVSLDVARSQIDGDRAEVAGQLTWGDEWSAEDSAESQTYVFQLVREDGRWKIAGITNS